MPGFAEAAAAVGMNAHPFSSPENFRIYLAELGVL
jgi:hypothetical protein